MRVDYAERAIAQLESLYAYIAEDSGPSRAKAFVGSIVDYCEGLNTFPHRGRRRDDILPGLRLLGFRRRVTIAYTLDVNTVTVLGIFYGGQDFEAALMNDSAAG